MKKYFQTSIQYGAPAGRIDREQGIIHGVTIARTGAARGHGAFIDKTALLQIVDLAAARPQGIKARFGHPNMCNTALGTYLGRFHNYSYNADSVTADLHLDASAKETPNGNLFDYVLNLAESNPDMFGASIVFENDKFHVESFTDDAGNEQEKRFFRIKELRATDIVDEPAATDGLFSADSLPALATQFLDENPEFTEFLFTKPHALIEFLHNYLNLSAMNLTESVKTKFRQLFKLEDPANAGAAGADFQSVSSAGADFKSVPQPTTGAEPPPAGADFKSVPPADVPEVAQVASFAEVAQVPEVAPVAQVASIAEVAQVASFAEVAQVAEAAPNTEQQTPNNKHETKNTKHETQITLSQKEYLEQLHAFNTLATKLDKALAEIESLKGQLNVRQTLPRHVADPAIEIPLDESEKDQTGKVLIKSMPDDLKFKLRNAKS